jgi:acetyltransferase-like isoleucine patch superfamily enzyme
MMLLEHIRSFLFKHYWKRHFLKRLSKKPKNISINGIVDISSPKVVIGERCGLWMGVYFRGNSSGVISIGDDVFIGDNVTFNATQSITIGSDSMISSNVFIVDHDHGMDPDTPMRTQKITSAPVTIGKNVWLGANVVVLKGVTIGDGAVIGAGSVVTHDIPSMAVALGSPAQIKRYRK